MDRDEAAALTERLLAEHGLRDWHFAYNRQLRGLGMCRYKARRIELSIHYVDRNEAAHIRDTILHEIAHALAGPRVGHGPKWKRICQRLGCEPKATCRDSELRMPPGKWQASCERCGMTYHRHRRPARGHIHFCGKCGRGAAPLRWGRSLVTAHRPM